MSCTPAPTIQCIHKCILFSYILCFLVKHDGNLSLTEILEIARQMHSRSISRNLAGTVKQILGTAQSVGCTVEGEPPHDIIDKIDEGEIDIPVSSLNNVMLIKQCYYLGFCLSDNK